MNAPLRLVAICSLACLPAWAAPQVTGISPRGMTAGGETLVTLQGSQLDAAGPRLLSEWVSQQEIVRATAGELQLKVRLRDDAPPGIYRWRVANGQGVSNAWLAGVDRLPQIEFESQVTQLPAALSGTLNGPAILETTFRLDAGATFAADVECRRLGGAARPVLRLLDPRGVQVAFGAYRSAPNGDARLAATVTAAGEYTLQLHDMLYKAPASPFRLKLGDIRFASMVYPFAQETPQSTPTRFVEGNLLAAPATMRTSAAFPHVAIPLPAELSNVVGPLPTVTISGIGEWVEGSGEPIPAAPVGLNGVLDTPGQQDRFRVPVTAGQTFRFTVTSHRSGSPLDAVLTVAAVGGGVLGQNDDSGNQADPTVQAAIPANVSEVDVTIRDLAGRGGDEYVYRVSIEPAPQPSFSLKVTQPEIAVAQRGRQLLRITAQRTGYDGPIHLSALQRDGSASEVTIENDVIPPGATQAIVMLQRGDGPAARLLIQGRGEVEGRSLRSLAAVDAHAPQASVVPGALYDLASWTAAPLPLTVNDWTVAAKPYRGQRLSIPISVARSAGNVRLRLVSNQPTPKKKIKENNKDKDVDDIDRTLRLAGATTLAADTADVEASLVVPTDLPSGPWQVAVAAELLSDDGKTVAATAYSAVHVVEPIDPFRLELTSAAEVTTVAGGEDAGILRGTIHRVEGFAAAVKVTLQGLPKEYETPAMDVPAGESDFEFPVQFSDKAKPANLDKVQLVATWTPDDKVPQQTFRSNAIGVKLDIRPPAKP